MNRPRWRPALAFSTLALLVPLAATGCSGDGQVGSAPDPRRTPSPGASADAEPGAGASDRSTASLPGVLARAVADGPRRARNPRQVAAQIVAAEDAIADPATPPRVLAAAGWLQQVAYRELGARPGWDDRVRSSVPTRLAGRVRANVASRREFRSMHYTLSDTLPAWRIVEPAPARELLRHYREAERRFGVDWEYLAAINLVETGLGRIRGTSVAGAQGPMQFIPSTWARWGRGDIDDPRDAILAAGRYLASRGFARPGGRPGALYAYNNHPAYVRGVTRLAEVMQAHPRAFLGYYHWQIYYLGSAGDVLLPVGYEQQRPVPVRRWLARHPQA